MDTVNSGESSGDEFFDVVRRRHPDVDIILLPPEAPADDTSTSIEPAALDPVPARFETELADLWSSITDCIDLPELTSHWTYGSVKGSLSRESLVAVEGVDGVMAHAALARAERVLNESGWHTLVPPDGIPRVLASRRDEIAGRELQIIYVKATLRFAMTYSAGPYVVGDNAARAVIERTR